MPGKKPHRRTEGGVAGEAAPLPLDAGKGRAALALVVVVVVCIVAGVGLNRCATGFGNDTMLHEEQPGVTTSLSQYDSDGDGLVDGRYDVEDLDPAASPEGTGWLVGSASAYSLDDNDGGDATASGIPLDETSLTVAVPESQASLLGAVVEIYYGGICVEAVVTDTGGFEDFGRSFDLAPGVWRAFGADDVEDWGVRDISYRFTGVSESGDSADDETTESSQGEAA